MRHVHLWLIPTSCIMALALSALSHPSQESPMISRICVELPNLQSPMSLIVDDPRPIFADRLPPEEVARRRTEGKNVDMWTFFDDLVDFFCQYKVKGKFTVNSYVDGVGMIDRLTDPKRKKQLEEFVAILKNRLGANFDITPEIISHGVVINVETDQPLGVKDPEHIWSQTQDEDTLEKYIGRGLLALRNVGLIANGVTSPCDFGSKNEAHYVRAILRALKRVNGVKLAWYFLQSDAGDYIEPRLMYLDRRNAEAVVSIMPTGRLSDIGLSKKHERDIAKTVDDHITADGKDGLFPTLIATRSYIVFYKHWGLLYDQGLETGIKILREALERTRRFYAHRVQWMTCSDIARYYAASKSLRTTQRREKNAVTVQFESPFPCPGFTISFAVAADPKRIVVGDKELKRVERQGTRIEPSTWFADGSTVYACFDLAETTNVTIVF